MSPDEIVRACERLVLDSAAHNDARDWDALASIYAPDARLTRPSGQTVEGREAIRDAYASGAPDRRTRHLCTGIRVDVDADDRARATTTVLLIAWTEPGASRSPDGAPGLPTATSAIVGEFADTFTATADGWRIASRVARLDVALP